jgi:hypothetical protein
MNLNKKILCFANKFLPHVKLENKNSFRNDWARLGLDG